jgi:hypothetical protein
MLNEKQFFINKSKISPNDKLRMEKQTITFSFLLSIPYIHEKKTGKDTLPEKTIATQR